MRLADFIVANNEPILMAWELFARDITPAAKLDKVALRDHAQSILAATVQDMQSTKTSAERAAYAKEHRRPEEGSVTADGASEMHAAGRLGIGFNLLEVVSEYQALRASVLLLWGDGASVSCAEDEADVGRFNESIDQSVAKAVSGYTKRVDHSRDLFLAILGHDLRSPLNTIAVSTGLLPKLGSAYPDSSQTTLQIATSVSLMGRMISDLLDYSRTRLGAGMPVSPSPMDLGVLCREVFDEFRTGQPDRTIRYEFDGDLSGDWDEDRIRQAISNLVGNAIQHSPASAHIHLKLQGEESSVLIVVHNGGPPIPAGELSKIFEPLVRGSSAGKPIQNRPGSIGLGLYIAREVARLHGGRLDVTSTLEAGTAFSMRLPRQPLLKPGQPILDEEHVQNM